MSSFIHEFMTPPKLLQTEIELPENALEELYCFYFDFNFYWYNAFHEITHYIFRESLIM